MWLMNNFVPVQNKYKHFAEHLNVSIRGSVSKSKTKSMDIVTMVKMVLIKFLCLFLSITVTTASIQELPSWHMKPFGSHRSPDRVDESFVDNLLSPKEFAEKYVSSRRPIVLRNVVKEWPAFKLWTDEYLSENYGDMELRVEGKKEKQSGIPKGDVCLGRDRMKTFLSQYKNGADKYVVSELPTPMWGDVKLPGCVSCGTFLESFVEIDIWMNSDMGKKGKGGNSILHKDAFNTINCVVSGKKEWKLIELQYNDNMYQAWEGPMDRGYGGYSLVNPEMVSCKTFLYNFQFVRPDKLLVVKIQQY